MCIKPTGYGKTTDAERQAIERLDAAIEALPHSLCMYTNPHRQVLEIWRQTGSSTYELVAGIGVRVN